MIRSKYDPKKAPFACKHNRAFRFIDLFAGVGGIRLGMQNAGGKCVFSSEIDEGACLTYDANFGEKPHGDITLEETKSRIPARFDVLCGGFPCQPFSISGSRKGFEDTRGTLFFEICDIINRHHPRVLFLENVKNLIHHDNGNTMAVILDKLDQLGYKVSWRIMNAADFGVPQNRERCIIVASTDRYFDFDKVKKQRRVALRDFLDEVPDDEYLPESMYTIIPRLKQQRRSGMIFCGYRDNSIRKVIKENPNRSPDYQSISGSHKQNYRIYSCDGTYPALLANEIGGRLYIMTPDGRVRSLTIDECWRIMGFPENFVKAVAKCHQFRQVGNSICVTMVTAIAKEIRRQLLQPSQ